MIELKNIVKRFFNKTKSQKTAITLVEIMIVVVIVAIVGLVFMAMPKKDIKKIDRAKYYTAYAMLKRLQDENIAENGVPLNYTDYALNNITDWSKADTDYCYNNRDVEGNVLITKKEKTGSECAGTEIDGKYYCFYYNGERVTQGRMAAARNKYVNSRNVATAIKNRLNYMTDTTSDDYIDLTNGMRISNINTACNSNSIVQSRHHELCKIITVDINGNNVAPDNEGQDIHSFYLCEDGSVEPELNSEKMTTDWISFKVYHYDNNGTVVVDRNNVSYFDAKRFYYCITKKGKGRYLDSDSNSDEIHSTDYNCNGIAENSNTPYFMEAIKPL